MDAPSDQMHNASDNYEFWEKASIELDIAIDEQDETKCDEIVKCSHDDLSWVLDADNRKDFWDKADKLLKQIDVKLADDAGSDTKVEIVESDENSPKNFWAFFFLAKKIRAYLQITNNDKQLKKLDWVVDILIKKASAAISEDDLFQYLLLMIELAACTIGEQSLGFSEKAREIVNDKQANFLDRWKVHAYKALIYYNQGLAKAHMVLYHDALEDYNKSLEEYTEAKNESQDKKIKDHLIWRMYVYYPTLLQKAETLIKMQFSYNALTTLEEIGNHSDVLLPSPFIMARKEFLKAICYLEIEDRDRFNEHFRKEINQLNKNGRLYFEQSSGPKSPFLAEINPQKPSNDQHPPWLLASSYNSLVLDGAREELRQKVNGILNNNGKIPNNLSNLDIFRFIETYMDQCKDNRFDRLTLQETILSYIEILLGLLGNELENSLDTPGPVTKTINTLLDILDKSGFVDEVSNPDRKPLIRRDCIEKARQVFGDITDTILKAWFQEKELYALPEHLRGHFESEKVLIEALIGNPVGKSYEKKCLRVRHKLLSVIITNSYQASALEQLEHNLVCICDNDNINEKRTKCLKHVLDVIGLDSALDNEGILQFADYDEILARESRHFKKHMTGRSIQPLPLQASQHKVLRESNYSVNYVGLRRWNSYTPELSFSVGGGHFVFLSNDSGRDKGKILAGIAIDPGFDFIRNFFRQGFTLTDIDIVLLTHGHPDHIRDFPAIVELLLENRKRGTSGELDKKRIYSVMSLGCYQRLREYIAKDPFKLLFYDTFIVDIDKNHQPMDLSHKKIIKFSYNNKNENKPIEIITPNDNPKVSIKLDIDFFKSFHDDHSESDSYGYIITFSDNDVRDNRVSVGFTGDSKWFPEYSKKFQECDIICSHIGSIVEPNMRGRQLRNYSSIGKAERLIRTKNHPYLFGEILFLQDWKEIFSKKKKTIVLISEFGEEMKGQIRSDLTKRLNRPRGKNGCWSDLGPRVVSCNWLKNFTSIIGPKDCRQLAECKKGAENVFTIPVDVGLRISVPLEINKRNSDDFPGNVHCVLCDQFVPPERIDYEVYSHEEAIFYVCRTCRRSVSIDVRHAIYQQYHEKGREIEKDETSQ